MSSTTPARFGVPVPVKPPAVAKSRLSSLGDRAREELVVAFASDTVAAALASPLVGAVLVVTDDHVLARTLAGPGVAVLPDGAVDDLNATLVQAAAELHRRWPDLHLVALTADLPALRPDELTRVLAAAPEAPSFVPDAEREGTTALLAPDPTSFRPRFGPGSRKAHLDDGCLEIDRSDVPGLRRDVDEPDDLAAALRLGVGPRTRGVVDARRL